MNLGIMALALTLSAPPGLPAPMGGPFPPTMIPPPGAIPTPPPAPSGSFLYVKVLAPTGTKTTYHPGMSEAKTYQAPATIGLRPGYGYRLALSNIPNHPGVTLFPSVEVRGTLTGGNFGRGSQFPVPIVFTEKDIQRVVEGRLLTKVLYLEDPEQALAVEGNTNEPIEFTANSEVEAFKEAQARGRILLIVRMGERMFTADELKRENITGTVLFPGANPIPTPACPPCFPFGNTPLFDPVLGPRWMTECLQDGGDTKRPLGIGPDNKLYGLDPTDTAMEFSQGKGPRRVVPSNRIRICVPRYASSRVELGITQHQNFNAALATTQKLGESTLGSKVPPQLVARVDVISGAIGSKRPSGLILQEGVVQVEQLWSRPRAFANISGVLVAADYRGPDDITSYPGSNLLLQKRVDPPNPKQIGEEVTIFLRYSNPTGQPMNDVVISDSLTARLEYVPGTAKSDRPATFTATPNEVGSVTVRWAIDGKLASGESGVISFKVKIR